MKKDSLSAMEYALVEAQAAAERNSVPVGAVITLGDTIIARAGNEVWKNNDPTAHAEMQAITAAMQAAGGKYLNECTLYVTVEPCVMCAGALAWAQIGRIVYGVSDPKRGYTTIGARVLHPKTTVTSGVLEQECAELMTGFFKKLRGLDLK